MEKWHTLYLKKSVVLNTYENGGLNMLDFCMFNNTFKINWAKHFIKNPTSTQQNPRCQINTAQCLYGSTLQSVNSNTEAVLKLMR